MPATNDGTTVRFHNGGTIQVGSNEILQVKSGSMKFKIAGYAVRKQREKGAIQPPLPGDERECTLSFDIHCTGTATGWFGLLPQLMGPLATGKVVNKVTASGLLFTTSITVRVPDFVGATTGVQYVFASCYMPDGAEFSATAGEENDMVKCDMEDAEMSPTITRY